MSRDLKDRKAFKKHERKDQIEREIAVHFVMSKKPMSARQIAKAIGMRVSSHLNHILEDMVLEGRLEVKKQAYKGGAVSMCFQYFIPAAQFGKALSAVYKD